MNPYLNFGEALERLKCGQRIAREGWNGKGLWVVLMTSLSLPPFNTQGNERKVNDRTAKWIGEDKPLESQAYFAIYDPNTNKWQPGWTPSTADCLANDWKVI